jgi:radical SAM-linked protein
MSMQAEAQMTTGRTTGAAQRHRLGVQFAIRGDLRYLSHHDTIRMFARALVRARLPVAYSQGFNPLPKLSLPLPRPVGLASEAELAWIELSEPADPRQASASLAGVLPADCPVLDVFASDAKRPPRPLEATYETALTEGAPRELEARIVDLLARERIEIERSMGARKPVRRIDIRPFIAGISARESLLNMRIRITEKGAARPAELLGELGLAAEQYIPHTRRTHVAWNEDLPASA